MSKLEFTLLAAITAVLLPTGCIKAPVELSMKKEIEISESEVEDIATRIYDNLAELDLSHPEGSPATMIDKDECSAAYKVWLKKQFDRGLVPRGMILSSTYGESSSNPLIYQCRAINFDIEFEKATIESASASEREARLFDFSEFKEILKTNKCIDNFLDPDKEKIEITSIDLWVKENTLTVASPTYKIYTSEKVLAPEILEEEDAEKKLLADNTLMKLGETLPFKSRFTGKIPVTLVDAEQKWYAEVPVVSLDGSVVAAPSSFAGEPETVEVAGLRYFVVPKGKVRLSLLLNVSVLGTARDAWCVYDKFIEDIKKEENDRRNGQGQ